MANSVDSTSPADRRNSRAASAACFRTLPPAEFNQEILMKLGSKMTADFEATPTPETKPDDEENSGISAGYTYLGQFIDHDLTFDPASSLERQNDPQALVDYRT